MGSVNVVHGADGTVGCLNRFDFHGTVNVPVGIDGELVQTDNIPVY